jgi:hypothetical protein
MKLLLTLATTSLLVITGSNTWQPLPAMASETNDITLLQAKGDGNKEGARTDIFEYLNMDGDHCVAMLEPIPTTNAKEMNLMWKTRKVNSNDWTAPSAWLDYKGHDGKLHASKIHATVNSSNKENYGYEFDVITRGINGDKEEKHHTRVGFQGYTGNPWFVEKFTVDAKGGVDFTLKQAKEGK